LKLKSKDIALMGVFAALYAVLSLVSLFPIIGAAGKFITLATIMAPLTGILLGPYMGAGAVSIGGFVWALSQTGAFGIFSFVPGAISALGSGLLYRGKQMQSAVLYAALLLPMAFYYTIGPLWLYPYFLWFQLIGFIVLASPLTPLASNLTRKNHNVTGLSLGVGTISLVSTLTGQIAGSFMTELFLWPTNPQIEYWRALWQPLTFIYPAERLIIVMFATLVGVPLIKAVRAYGIDPGGR